MRTVSDRQWSEYRAFKTLERKRRMWEMQLGLIKMRRLQKHRPDESPLMMALVVGLLIAMIAHGLYQVWWSPVVAVVIWVLLYLWRTA